MAGFPAKPVRASFGPQLVNKIPVRDPSRELGADAMNLAFWQLAGCGRVLPAAVIAYDPTLDATTFQYLAFDPLGALATITVSHPSTGNFSFTFDATYADERGVQVAFSPQLAMAFSLGNSHLEGAGSVSGQTVNATLRDFSDALADGSVLILVWG